MPFMPLRRSRRMRLLSMIWRRRAVFVLGGIVVGAAAVGLTLVADYAQDAFARLTGRWHYASLIVTTVGFGVAAYMTRRYFPNSQGSGIPQAIAARALESQRARSRLVSIRIAIGKVLVTSLGLLCGASIGREGPTVQVGASIMFAIGRLSPRRQAGLILAGASAGVAAAFNAPLAGIVFGIEEMSRSFEVRASGLIIGGIIAAGLTSLALVGNYTYFGSTSANLSTATGWLAVPVCGVAGGLLGGVFSRILILFGEGLPGAVGGAIKRHPIWFAMLCGLLAAICDLASGHTISGTGYSEVRGLLNNGIAPPQSFGLLKMLGTTLASISGIPGGIFSPSLAVGAGIGLNVSVLFPGVPLGALLLLGMVSYFSGVVQAPITAFVIVTEMTNDHAMVIPLMTAALIGYASSRLVCAEGVYHALSKNFLREGRLQEEAQRAAAAEEKQRRDRDGAEP